MLSDEEALAVLLGLVAGRRAGLMTAAGTAGETAAAKIRRVLPERLARRLNAVLGSLAFTAPPGEFAAPESSVLLCIANAVRHHRPVSIRYTAADGRPSERTLHPYGLVAHSGRWYVTGADPGIGEDRTFRLDRIADARTLPGSFEPPAGLDPAQRVLSGLATAPYRHQVTLRIQASAEQIRARLPASVASIESADADPQAGAGSASTCGRSGSTGCPRCSPPSTGRSSSSGPTSSAASSSRSPQARRLGPRRLMALPAWRGSTARQALTALEPVAVTWPRRPARCSRTCAAPLPPPEPARTATPDRAFALREACTTTRSALTARQLARRRRSSTTAKVAVLGFPTGDEDQPGSGRDDDMV